MLYRLIRTPATGASALIFWVLVSLGDFYPRHVSAYPAEALRRHEEGLCIVKITVTAEGNIEDPTITYSTGFPSLDDACLRGVRGNHMRPAVRDGRPITLTAKLPINWRINTPGYVPIRRDPQHPPRIGTAYYPAAAAQLREEGTCVVKVSVSSRGEIHDIVLRHSTGSRSLDQACLDAYKDGGLLPATRNGIAVDSSTELPILWRLRGPAAVEEQGTQDTENPSQSAPANAAPPPVQ